MSETKINSMKGNLRGLRGEKITVKLVKYEELWKEGARDAKTSAAWALYEGLIREGKIRRR
jgi:ADP-sugar diphosphatase